MQAAGLLIVLAIVGFFLRPKAKGIIQLGVAPDDFFGGRSRLDHAPLASRGNPVVIATVGGLIGIVLLFGVLQQTVFPVVYRTISALFEPRPADTLAVSTAREEPAPAVARMAPVPKAAPVLESGPLPDNFNLLQAQAALSGANGALNTAFVWANTSQGQDFWSRENDSLNNSGQVSDNARAILQSWISAAKVEAGPLPSNFNAAEARNALKGDTGAVDRAFKWASSSQGADFWKAENESVNAGKALSPKAARVLLTWIGISGSESGTP